MLDHDDSRGDYLEPVLDALLRIERKVDALVARHTYEFRSLPNAPALGGSVDMDKLRDDPTRTPQEQG